MTINLQKIKELTAQWQQLPAIETNSVSLDSTIDKAVEPQDSPAKTLLKTMSKLNQKTQEVIDSIPIFLPIGLQQQKQSKNWYSVLKNLSVETLNSLRLLEPLSISEENESIANRVLANCLATAATTLAVAKAFRSLISSTYEPEAVQMIAQAFGNHALSPLHEIERVPKDSVKKLLVELYGEGIVNNVFKLYKLNKNSHITSDDLRALLIGILANLDEATLKHIVTNKEQHKQITAFAFFDQFLKHPNSNIDKRFAELQPDQLIGFSDCLRKSVIDIDLSALLSPEANYYEQVLRDVNLIYYCKQRTIHPDFPVTLSDVLETFNEAGQIEGTLIPLSDQSFLPLSDILRPLPNQEPVSSSSSHPVSFFPKETLSCYFNSELLPRIELPPAGMSSDEELFMDIGSEELPGLQPNRQPVTASSRPLLHEPVEPFEFLAERHPLADIADMIEKMRSGIDAQKVAVKLDPKSKALFGKHESALFENPEPFFQLYELINKMQNHTILEDKGALKEVFEQISDPLRKSLAYKIYQLSNDPTKSSIKNWGELHAFDDLSQMLEVMTSLRDNIFASSYKKITKYASNILTSLSSDIKVGVYYEIFRMVKPQTTDLNWGENHALDKVSRLVTALSLRGAINEPNPLLHRLRSHITNVQPLPSTTHPTLSTSAMLLNSSSLNSRSPLSVELSIPDQPLPLFIPLSPSTSSERLHPPLPKSQSHVSVEMPRPNPLLFPSTPLTLRTSSGRLHPPLPKSESLVSIQELKPIQLFPERHPLAELAELIENMRLGSPLNTDAQISFVHLDEASRTLFAKHECALLDNPSPFFYLIDLVEKMLNSSISENKSSVLEAFNRVPDPLRHSLAAKIFQLSKDPTKGNIKNWGEVHAADDLLCLNEALANLKSKLLNSTYSKITAYGSSILSSLDLKKQEQVYFEIFRIGNPTSNERDWGKKNALEITSRLITALTLSGAINIPENISHRSTRRELHWVPPHLPNPSFLTPSKAPLPHTPSKSQGKDVAQSLNQFFSVSSPFSPNKGSGFAPSPTSSTRRVLFPVNPSSSIPSNPASSAPNVPLPPAPLFQILPKLSPKELHHKSELNRLKKDCESRLRFNELYTTAPLSSSQSETIYRLEGNISSCRSTISLLHKQGHDTDFTQNIIKALNESIKENEKEINDIKNSNEISFKDYNQFKYYINSYTTNEIKLILHEISPQLREHTDVLDEIGELQTFYDQFENEELKTICKSCSHLYNQLLINGPGRFLTLLTSTLKQRMLNPSLEPVHEPRPFKNQKRDRLSTNNQNSPKPPGSPSLDISEIANFRFKRQQSQTYSSARPHLEGPSTPSYSSMLTPLRLRNVTQHHQQKEIKEIDHVQAKRDKRLLRQQLLIEEAQQTKYEQLEENFAREKLVALATEALKPNLQINEQRQALEAQLLIAEASEQAHLNSLLAAVLSQIRLKEKDDKEATSFLQQASSWKPSDPHPFVTEERLQLAKTYAKKQVDEIKNRQI